MVIRALDSFQSTEILALREPGTSNLISRPQGVYRQDTRIQGNSILSTVYVHSIDANTTISVNYLEATVGTDQGELLTLGSHPLITSSGNPPSKILVTRIHNKPICEVIISGGSATLGVYITVVGTSSSDIDNALQLENELVNLNTDKGMPIAGVVESTGTFKFLRFDDSGALKVSGLLTADVKNTANLGKITIVPINSNSWTPLPHLPLTNRVSLSVQNKTGYQVVLNYDTPSGFVGKILEDGDEASRDLDANSIIYAKASSNITASTIDLIVEELANV